MLLAAILIGLTPAVATYAPGGHWAVIAIQALTGCVSSAMYPGMFSMYGKWITDHDRGKAIALSDAGSLIGAMAMAFIGPAILSASGTFSGWEICFVVPAAIGLALALVWSMLVYDTPQDHPWVSPVEADWIQGAS